MLRLLRRHLPSLDGGKVFDIAAILLLVGLAVVAFLTFEQYAISNDEEVARRALPFEFMLNALRLREGMELVRFTERTGLPLSAIEAPLAEAQRRGLIERDGGVLRPTARGFDFLSDLQSLFLPAP